MLKFVIIEQKNITKISRRSMFHTRRVLVCTYTRGAVVTSVKTAGFATHIGKWSKDSKHYKERVSHGIQHEVVVDDAIKNGESHAPTVLTKNSNCGSKDPTVTSVFKLDDKLAKTGKDQPQMAAVKANSPPVEQPDWDHFIQRREITQQEHDNFIAGQAADRLRKTNKIQ